MPAGDDDWQQTERRRRMMETIARVSLIGGRRSIFLVVPREEQQRSWRNSLVQQPLARLRRNKNLPPTYLPTVEHAA